MLQAYLDWLVGTALPFWAESGFDCQAGRFHERLDLFARPMNVPHRAMVQARQIYVFAHAAELGWFPEGGPIAERAMETLVRDYADSDDRGSFAFSITCSSSAVAVSLRDSYTHAFILLALAWLYRRSQDPALLEQADHIFAFIDSHLRDPTFGGLFDTAPIADRTKRQNPLMHLLEACLFLEESAPGRGYLERARAIVTICRARLFQAVPGVLVEHFDEDWSTHPAHDKAGIWEPGHHMEWVWLLSKYSGLAKDSIEDIVFALYNNARLHGCSQSGILMEEIGIDFNVLRSSFRLWPQTEAVKAAIVRNDRAFAEAIAAIITERFVGKPFAGGWTDRIDTCGRALIDHVPASSLYHLFMAGAEAAGAFQLTPKT